MKNRREFIKDASIATLAGIFLSKNPLIAQGLETHKSHAIGLQLFTFFGVMDDDVQGTLKKISEVGFLEIESAFSKKGAYYGMSPKEFAKTIRDLGMRWKSHHVLGAPFKLPPGAKMPLGADGKPIVLPTILNLKDNMQRIVDEAAEGGLEFLVCANTPIHTLSEIQDSIEVLNKAGEACKKSGIQFAYHNHDAEFREVEGKIPYDLFISELDPHNVLFELDLAWAIKGGGDPVSLFKSNPGRFPLWHLKDLDSSRTQVLPVGQGTLSFQPIFDAAKIAGMKHFFVEHDGPKDALASIKTSYSFITTKLKV